MDRRRGPAADGGQPGRLGVAGQVQPGGRVGGRRQVPHSGGDHVRARGWRAVVHARRPHNLRHLRAAWKRAVLQRPRPPPVDHPGLNSC